MGNKHATFSLGTNSLGTSSLDKTYKYKYLDLETIIKTKGNMLNIEVTLPYVSTKMLLYY